jgi:hypothetical protein
MVVTKYCGLVLEPSFRKAGLDFYKRGANIAIANILTTTIPIFLNTTTWFNFFSLFVRVIRERKPPLFNEWRSLAELIFSHLGNKNRKLADLFAPILIMRDCNELFETLGEDELDPLVPAYHCIVDYWGRSIGSLFEVIADESKVLAKERGRLLALSNQNLKPFDAGYDRRRIEFPLKVADIMTVDSTTQPQIQLADVIGGAITCAAKARTKGVLQTGTFAHNVLDLCFSKGIIIGAVWPNADVDPRDLETDIEPDPKDVDLATYTASILKSHPSTKKSSH